jgi:hypothetical protein
MPRCFVIQPFDDGGPYDKRYKDVLFPAINDAGLEPSRLQFMYQIKAANRVFIVLAALLFVGNICLAQSDKRKLELFTSYLGTKTLPAKANIPAETCRVIITQADRIVASDELKTFAKRDLQVASLNLRTCATAELARLDRGLAVGLYGEVVSEVERRERAEK